MDSPVFEKLLQEVGDNGRHQQLLLWLFVVPINFFIPWVALAPIFMTSTPQHWCNVPGRPQEISLENWKMLTIPKEAIDGKEDYSKCQQYNVTWNDLWSFNLTSDLESLASTFNASFGIIGCQDGWQYDHSDYDSTLSMDQDWVCDRDYLGANWQAIGIAGNVFGTLIFNSMSDILGRRPVFVVAVMMYAVFGILRLYVSSYTLIMMTMFLASTSFPAILELPLIIVMEQVCSTWRVWITSTSFILWTAGMCVLPLIVWLSRDWVLLGLITTIPFFGMLMAWWFLPESPRWLLSRNQLDKTVALLKSIAHRNGKPIPEKLEHSIQSIAKIHNTEQNYGILQLCQLSRVGLRTFLLTVCYTCNSLFYYGLIYNTTNISGNEFLNFFLLGITELPSNLLGWWGAEYIGRRWTAAGCFLLAALFALVAACILGSATWAIILVLILSKMCIAMSFLVIYIQCAEIYPTTHRGAGTGLSSLISSCFGTTAPYIAYLSVHGEWVPYIIIFAIGILGFICASLLPETLNIDLPQSLKDASNFLPSEKYLSYKGRRLGSKSIKIMPHNGEQQGHINSAISVISVDNPSS